MFLWAIYQTALLTLSNSELLAKTSEEVEKIHKQQLDSSHNVSELLVAVRGLNASLQTWVKDQDHQLEEIQKKLQSSKT